MVCPLATFPIMYLRMDPVPTPLKAPVSRRRWWIHLGLVSGYLLVVGALGLGRKPSHMPALLHTAGGLLLVCGLELLLFGLVFALAPMSLSRNQARCLKRMVICPHQPSV